MLSDVTQSMRNHRIGVSQSPALWKYALTAVLAAAAFGAVIAAQNVLSVRLWFCFVPAVAVSAWLGRETGWMAVVLSTLAVDYCSAVPFYASTKNRDDMLFLLVFSALSVLVGWIKTSLSPVVRIGEAGFAADPVTELSTRNKLLAAELAGCKSRLRSQVERQVAERTAEVKRRNDILVAELAARNHVDHTGMDAQADGNAASVQKTNEVLVAELAERKEAEDELRRAHNVLARTQSETAIASRVMTVDELTASIAHEVNQPLAAVVASANACERWLAATPPNLERARVAVGRIVRDGARAGEIVQRIRSLFKKGSPEKEWLNLNELIEDMSTLLRNEGATNGIVIRTGLAPGLPQVMADRVQIQQVLLNLMKNGIDAMGDVTRRDRVLHVKSTLENSGQVMVSVTDAGSGLSPEHMHKLFDAFFTTKPHGMGMGLAISRSIIESHGGRLWATPEPRGATFQFSIPTEYSDDK